MKSKKPIERPSMQGGRDGKHVKEAARHSSPILGSLQIANRDLTFRNTEDERVPDRSVKLNVNRSSNSSDISVPGSSLHTDSGISSSDSLAGGDKRSTSAAEHDFVSELLKLADTKFSDLNARESWVDEEEIAQDMKQLVLRPAEKTNAVLPVLGSTTADMATSTTSIFMTAMDVEVPTPTFHNSSQYETRPDNFRHRENERDKLTCSTCGEVYNTPRLLPCLHTFCTNCLQSRVFHKEEVTAVKPEVIHSSGDESMFSCETLECPTCSTKVELSLEGVYGLPVNHTIQRLLVLHNLKSGRTNELSCDLCPDSSKIEARCIQCNVNMCQFCFQAHKRQSLTAAHYVISTSEMDMVGCKSNFSARSRKANIPIMCQRHTSEELKLYCMDCSQLVCRDCCLGSKHKDHKCEYLNHVIERKTSELSNEFKVCESKIQSLRRAITLLEQSEKVVDETAEEVSGKIERHILSYINTLQRHKATLLSAVEAKAKTRREIIRVQKNEVQKLLDDVNHSCEFTSQLLETGSNHEILSMKPYVMNRLKKLSQTSFVEAPSPAENFVEFKANKKVKAWIDGDMASALGKSKRSSRLLRPGLEVDIWGDVVSHAIEVSNCTAHGEGTHCSRVRLPSEFIVVTKNFDGERLESGGHDISASITMDGVDSNLFKNPKVQITDRQDGTYRVLYMIYAAGSYSIDVRILGKPISGSPFHISAVDPKTHVHSGIFHCCCFCSSGGDKNSTCACGAVMPGGYKGCGHGCNGHPGTKHWSCCGNITETSSCGKSVQNVAEVNSTYLPSSYSAAHQSNTLPVRRNPARDLVNKGVLGDDLYATQKSLRTQRGILSPGQFRRQQAPLSPLTKQIKTVTL